MNRFVCDVDDVVDVDDVMVVIKWKTQANKFVCHDAGDVYVTDVMADHHGRGDTGPGDRIA